MIYATAETVYCTTNNYSSCSQLILQHNEHATVITYQFIGEREFWSPTTSLQQHYCRLL